MITKDVYDFLCHWLQDAESDEPSSNVQNYGLCYNWGIWCGINGCDDHDLFGEEAYPFGQQDYRERRWFGTMHLCENRLAWVRDQIIKYNGQ